MKPTAAFLLVFTCLVAGPSRLSAICEVDLSGEQVVPPTPSPAEGFAYGTDGVYGEFDLAGSILFLVSPPIAVELRVGAAGENGRLFYTIPNLRSNQGGFWFHVQIPLDEAIVDSIRLGYFHLVVTTQAFPDGEIRGQISCRPDPTNPTTWGRLKAIFR